MIRLVDVGRARRTKLDIIRVCHLGLDSKALALEAERLLRAAIPFDRACWHNVDPATSMLTSVIGESAPTDPLLPMLEYGTTDVNQYADLAKGRTTVAALRQATRNEPACSQRFREVLSPMGMEDELTAAFVVDSMVWGCARFYRGRRWPAFDAVEVAFLASISGALGEGFRSALLAQVVTVGDADDGPGVLVLDPQGRIESMSAGAERWLADVIDIVPTGKLDPLPHPVYAVMARARAIGTEDVAALARCRVPTRSGRWLVLHGTLLHRGSEGRVAVIVEPAPSSEVAPLMLRAYGLTEREREVAGHVLRGLATKQIASELAVSPYTVSDHLRVVFEKLSVNSRTELVARIFFDQYYPRIGAGRPLARTGCFGESESPSNS